MGVYTKTTLSGKIAYKVDYKCEKCGETNSFIYTSTVSSAYTNKTISKSQLAQREEDAKFNLLNKMAQHEKAVDANIASQNFDALHIKCKCQKCSHIPSWSASGNSFENMFFLLSILGKYVGVISALFFVAYLIDKEFNLTLLIIAVLSLGIFFSYRICKDEKARKNH